jgi:hypothetical protein
MPRSSFRAATITATLESRPCIISLLLRIYPILLGRK